MDAILDKVVMHPLALPLLVVAALLCLVLSVGRDMLHELRLLRRTQERRNELVAGMAQKNAESMDRAHEVQAARGGSRMDGPMVLVSPGRNVPHA